MTSATFVRAASHFWAASSSLICLRSDSMVSTSPMVAQPTDSATTSRIAPAIAFLQRDVIGHPLPHVEGHDSAGDAVAHCDRGCHLVEPLSPRGKRDNDRSRFCGCV